MSAIRNSGVSVFEGVVKCAINGMYCPDYALCPHYSVSPHFRGVWREGFHCIWTPVQDEILRLIPKPANSVDRNAVAVMKEG